MKNDDNNFIFGIVLGMIVGAILMLLIVSGTDGLPNQVTRKIQQEAVDNGVAEWKITTDGVSYFEWKKN